MIGKFYWRWQQLLVHGDGDFVHYYKNFFWDRYVIDGLAWKCGGGSVTVAFKFETFNDSQS